MPNRNYEKGYRGERKEQEYLEALGFWTQRSYGSKGAFDVVATNGVLTLFHEVKTYTNQLPSFANAKRKLEKIPPGPNVQRAVVFWRIKRGIKATRKVMEV